MRVLRLKARDPVIGTPTFDLELVRRHDRPGPRYTSYPSAPQFSGSFGAAQLRHYLAHSNAGPGHKPLSLYVHIPFCRSPCFYCACNRVITRDTAKGEHYADRLLHEIRILTQWLDPRREVVQLHLGGGTPNFLSKEALARLVDGLGRACHLSAAPERDFSIELDPRSVPHDYVPVLTGLGFNRVSLGAQDFDPVVQDAVNRVQSVDETLDLIDACRDHGFRSVNVDLIYGLPRQTLAGFRRTLRTVISARPDRLAVYSYAHLPLLFKAQRRIKAAELPTPEARLDLLRLAIEELCACGYRYIGMDHFAVPEDDLVRAQEAGELQRNFMGYTTHAHCDLIGVGVSAISHVGNSFSQNLRDLPAWEAALDAERLPVWRGLELGPDDCVRAAVIGQLMCQGVIDIPTIEKRFQVDFPSYFNESLARLQPHVADGLVQIEPKQITATPAGRLLLRSIAMCFDAYLSGPRTVSEPAAAFSRVV